MDALSEQRRARRPEADETLGSSLGPITAETVADALAVLMVDLVSALPGLDRREALEQLANRLDNRGRTPNGKSAARLLGEVGAALMRMGC